MREREPIGVIGTGYVGLVTAAGFAELGSDVYCRDIDEDKIARLRRGEVPIYEPGLDGLLERNRERLHFATDLAPALEHARLLFVAVGTPSTYSGDADLSAVRAVVDAMPPSDRHALVMKSTVPVGTGRSIRRLMREQGKGSFSYVSCPEFLKEGSAVHDFLHPDRVVIGDTGDWGGDAVADLYAPLEAPVVRTDIASAEMVKLASNAFLATKISFINEIANVCEEVGADVTEVARGMGLDERIGRHFLRPGIGYGGSCLAPDETLLVRHRGRTELIAFERLWRRMAGEHEQVVEGLIEPDGLEVLSWPPGDAEPRFLEVACLTRRDVDGELIEVRTKMGRRVRCTPDHPWYVGDGRSAETRVKLAEQLTTDDWLPLAQGRRHEGDRGGVTSLVGAVESAGLEPRDVIVRPPAERVTEVAARPVAERRAIFSRVATELATDAAFWRVVGLYLAGGNAVLAGRAYHVDWSFHPTEEQHLVDEVVAYWLRHGVQARTYDLPTARMVSVRGRLPVTWWTKVLGLGRSGCEQRLPDLIWDRCDEDKWALLSGLFEGDGSWSLINGGPGVIIELGTVSDELADGVMRLLGDVGIVAARGVGRTRTSTEDTHWIRISGAEQVARALALVPERDRPGVRASIARQRKRIAPMGSRRFDGGPAWLRAVSVERRRYRGPVYSLEVPATHSVVATGGLITHNCFPKDVSALKQLAGNSGYHFQLLTSVIEVNELQKRRVIAKLQKHLGSLVGKEVALLGLAFKPETDDMREASSLVLAARLQADGARVRAYDPVAEEEARMLLPGVTFPGSAVDTLADVDAAVLVTEWDEFKALDWTRVCRRMRGRLVVDGRNALDPGRVRAAGLIYEGIGRGDGLG
jgi:UDPglucose 6-dehydrogenase